MLNDTDEDETSKADSMERQMNGKLKKLTLKVECCKPGMARKTFWFDTSFRISVTDSWVAFRRGQSKRKRSKRLWRPR